MTPSVVFYGKLPASALATPQFARKLEILRQHLRPVFIVADVPIAIEGAEVIGVPRWPFASSRQMGYYAGGAIRTLSLCWHRNVDAVVCKSPFEGGLARIATRVLPRNRRPQVVVEVHGDWRASTSLYGSRSRSAPARLVDSYARWAIRHADRARAIGSYTKALVREAGYLREVDVYPTFTDIEAFLATPTRPLPNGGGAVFIGSCERVKGWDILIDAWSELAQRGCERRLTVAGTGSDMDAMKQSVQSKNLSECVDFLGTVPHSKIMELLDESYVLVLPSRSEGLGRVVLEAQARSRPVVASAVGGIPELISDGETGLLVSSDDSHALANRLADLFADPDRARAMGSAARASVVRSATSEFADGVAAFASWLESR